MNTKNVFNEGYNAFFDNLDCPYDPIDKSYHVWNEGHEEAEADNDDDDEDNCIYPEYIDEIW